MSAAGPFDRWPTGLGFEYFYGFLGADTSMWAPNLVENTVYIDPPYDDPSYHFEKDLADKAVSWLRNQNASAPDKPFLMYYASGAAHAPHHAPPEWLARFRGKFDMGWDKVREQTFAQQKALGIIPRHALLTPRPESLPAWETLSSDQKRLYARFMEAYAASLSYTDHQIGRVIRFLKENGQFDNTLIIYINGDNGGSAEGGLNGRLFEQTGISGGKERFEDMLASIEDIGSEKLFNHYPAAWGWAMNTPFPWYKQVASQAGGVRNGMVISWPDRIRDKGALRSQYAYVTDIMPTVLEVAGVSAPAVLGGVQQQPVDGISLKYSFADAGAPSRRHTQVLEAMENFGIYHDGWIAGVLPKRTPWNTGEKAERNLALTPDKRTWALFNIEKDFSTATDLAGKQPAKLAELKMLFWKEAEHNNIPPIHDYSQGAAGRPDLNKGRAVFRYTAGVTRIPESAAPPTIGRSFRIDAETVIPEDGAGGVIVTQGGRYGGYAFYLKDNRPVFHYNAVGADQFKIVSRETLAPGPRKLTAIFKADAARRGTPGTLTLLVDGKTVGEGRIGRTFSGWMSHTEGFDVGRDTITPINDDYRIANSGFTGALNAVVVALD